MRKIWLPLLFTLVGFALIAVRQADQAASQKSEPGKPRLRVVLALPTQPSNAGWFVGIEKGYFAEQGVELVNQPHAIGLQAQDAVIRGRADLALVADTPVMFAVMRGADLSIVATTYSSRDYMALVARGDRGIARAADLSGKKIGYVPNTSGHFFLYSLLLANGLGSGRALPTVVSPAESVALIGSGALDALVSWEPTLTEAKAAIGASAVVFHGPELYTVRFSLVGLSSYVSTHPAELKALLKGLMRANDFIREQPEQARLILAKSLHGPQPAVVEALVPGDYRISLDQGQLITLEDQARWALKEDLVPQQPVPNFLRHMDLTTLVDIAPENVTLVR
ncbi:MAG: ABC transporter substrate-binding protein [Pseudomonadota bacterium]